MKELPVRLTIAQFAALHKLNKRTLHYYDEIGLFSPKAKGENGYRYYELSQSVELETILMLKELNLSIEEIRNYVKAPGSKEFVDLADAKLEELDREINRLRNTRRILNRKRQQLLLCGTVQDGEIAIVQSPMEYLLVSADLCREWDVEILMKHLRQAWDMEQYKVGCGSYISLEKVEKGCFEEYDGIFSPVQRGREDMNCMVRPAGRYLCGYVKGDWGKIPGFYRKMLEFARDSNLKLTGFSYELGLNEFAAADFNEYMTQIMIKIDDARDIQEYVDK